MINNIRVTNFKSLKDVNLEFENLNLLTGMNSAGKSSLIQSILFLRQNTEINENLMKQINKYKTDENDALRFKNELMQSLINKLYLNGKYIDLGVSGNLLYEGANTDEMSFDLTLNNTNVKFYCNLIDNSEDYSITCKTTLGGNIDELYEDNKFNYLSAERIIPKSVYEYSKDNILNENIGNRGEYTAHYLAENKNSKLQIEKLKHPASYSDHLLENVSLWLSEISEGIDVSAEANSELQNSSIKYSYGSKKFLPQNVGFGITYVLPIIVLILKSKPGDLLIIENPESHLHPSGQAEVAKLCARAAAAGVQIIIETHSDHFLNGVRVATKEKFISNGDVNIYYFTKNIENGKMYTKIQNLNLQNDGKIDIWPKGFFDEWDIQLEKLLW